MTFVCAFLTIVHLAMTGALVWLSGVCYREKRISNAKFYAVGAAFLAVPTAIWAANLILRIS
ncbi:gp030 [Erwinia phage vB_EamP-S6]|uniref:Gp030 n=1 Tax=Erwinia phage vB_EamP-S6 TaxID=1051675 RepID=G0YQC2_9CAUD|nr:gp030 [Erwinia phage vB_EamP-S6]AEJ81549.1 gp030 [Erwinia phage vB_EamP-S6]